ncbi:MAG: hypothetical protein ABEJ99_02270 [Candidatus Nanohaloarchaea archaeon]
METPEPDEVRQLGYRYLLLMLLAVTRAVASFDVAVPPRWMSILDSVRASSGMMHVKLSALDEDVSNDFIKKEETLERTMGKIKYYDVEELKELKKKSHKIEV